MAEWVRSLAWAGDRTVSRPGSNPATATSLRNFGNSVYPPECDYAAENAALRLYRKKKKNDLGSVYST